jgi:hypothetical protein
MSPEMLFWIVTTFVVVFNLVVSYRDYKLRKELDEMSASWKRMKRQLDARVDQVYTKEEWNAVGARLRKQYPQLFDGEV